jgi:hypothetical protein
MNVKIVIIILIDIGIDVIFFIDNVSITNE